MFCVLPLKNQNAEIRIEIGDFPACDICGNDSEKRYKIRVFKGKSCRTFLACTTCRQKFRDNRENLNQFFEQHFEPYSFFRERSKEKQEVIV